MGIMGTPRYFRELWSGAREINYGNTVLVNRADGQWWLGYVQDVNGEHFFVDFDASTVQAEWIHSSHLWPHHFPFVAFLDHYVDRCLNVALRDKYGGPMIFRPATVIMEWDVHFLAVRLDENNPVKKARKSMACRFVHRGQFAERLPVPGDGQNFFARTDGLTFVKHVIALPAAGALNNVDSMPAFVGPTCQFTLGQGDREDMTGESRFVIFGNSTDFYSVGSPLGVPAGDKEAGYGVYVGCRVFVRVGLDTLTFVCVEIHNDTAGRRMSWNEDALKEACSRYLQHYAANIVESFPGALNDGHYAGSFDDNTINVNEISINGLPSPILECLLGDVDAESQQRFSRVCALWREIVGKYTDKRLVILDMMEMWPKKPYIQEFSIESDCHKYKLLATVDRAISQDITTLVIIDDGQNNSPFRELQEIMYAASTVLAAKGIRVCRIIVKNGYDVAAYPMQPVVFVTIRQEMLEMNQATWDEVMSVCDELVLINYMASQAITESANQLLYECTGGDRPVPEMLRPERKRSFVDLGVTIPVLRFRSGIPSCREEAAEECRRFLVAANDSCPAVSQHVLQKVTALHARWVETLEYHEWNGIRKFLTLLNSLRPTDTPRPWETMDLRQLDVSTLNNLTFAALHGCYKDEGDEDDEEDDTEDDDEDDGEDDYEENAAVE
ncbi:uncharacterized protein LOC129596810 isoform X2 [Paramacrobiotus metropolitanus]|uniref:uncharacterized protein LOC129596810 isoform X2 n=1 Tax=Paramacrobiotus metropolitanus TaxID=2943436 RepID=UPI002445F729|nr:uncharacterized protein LOC129596810 isoform X2 [Paramacrobiotus metropolitanus]